MHVATKAVCEWQDALRTNCIPIAALEAISTCFVLVKVCFDGFASDSSSPIELDDLMCGERQHCKANRNLPKPVAVDSGRRLDEPLVRCDAVETQSLSDHGGLHAVGQVLFVRLLHRNGIGYCYPRQRRCLCVLEVLHLMISHHWRARHVIGYEQDAEIQRIGTEQLSRIQVEQRRRFARGLETQKQDEMLLFLLTRPAHWNLFQHRVRAG